MEEMLRGKRVLIVDDEPDILETLEELLDVCLIDKAPNFETAKKFLDKIPYDAAILDIMGVRGYDLLKLCREKRVPALMLTAHALSPDNLIKSIKGGALAYIPKDRITDIGTFLAEMLQARQEGAQKQGRWFAALKPFFDKKFGLQWREKDREFWKEFDRTYRVGRKELDDIL